MYCAAIGFLIFLAACFFTKGDPEIALSWWWLLWGSLIGLVIEIAARLGLGDVVESCADVFSAIGG